MLSPALLELRPISPGYVMRKFLQEVKRRNVSKVALVYIIAAWLTMQVVDVMFPALNVPAWLTSAIAVLLLIGFPFALIFAWAFELTPDGLKREQEVDRSQSITPQTGKKLNQLMTVALVLAVGFLLVDKFLLQPGTWQDPAEELVADVIPSIAVLPFVNMSDDADNEYFSDGLSEELLNVLARIPQLHVAGRTSSFQFKGENQDLRLIGDKLNVAHVLEGSVRRAGARLRITAQLIDTETGYHLWSNTYDRELTDVFAIQDEIAANVVDALKIALLGEEFAASNHGTENIEAYNLYLQATYFFEHISAENLATAQQALIQAISLDPDYALAYALLAVVRQMEVSGFVGGGDENFAEQYVSVTEYADTALRLDPNLAEANVAKGMAVAIGDWDFDAAVQHFSRALELAPNNLPAISWMGHIRKYQKRNDEATVLFEKVLQLDPLSISAHRQLGDIYMSDGRFDDALATYFGALRLQPDTARIHGRIAQVLIVRQEFDQAAEHMAVEPVEWDREMFEIVLMSRGENTAAVQAAAQAYENKYGLANSFQLAQIYGYAGDLDNAFKWLQTAYDVHDPGFIWMQVSPLLAPAHKDPRWQDMLELAGL